MNSCAIMGHHPSRFKFKYKENNAGCKRLKKHMREQFIALYEKGVRRFLTGGTLGVDIWSSEILLRLRTEPQYSKIELVTVIPFEGHDRDWDEHNKRRLDFLKAHSEVIIASSESGAVNYRRRDQYMLDHADCLLAVFGNDFTVRTSIGQTVNYALKKNMPVILIHPDHAKVICIQ